MTDWDHIRALAGRCLQTTQRKKRFTIRLLPHRDDAIDIVPESSQEAYRANRRLFEDAIRAGMKRRDVTPGQLKQAGLRDWQTSYVAAILAAIAD